MVWKLWVEYDDFLKGKLSFQAKLGSQASISLKHKFCRIMSIIRCNNILILVLINIHNAIPCVMQYKKDYYKRKISAYYRNTI